MEKKNLKIVICKSEAELKQITFKKSIDSQHECLICQKKYSSSSALRIHKIRHCKKEDLPFQCMFCNYKAVTKRDLLRHHDQHSGHTRQVYKCDLCKKMFKLNSSLTEHIRTIHTKDVLYECGMCSFSCWRRSTIRNHFKTHETKVQVFCPICGSTFQTKSNLKTHLMTHANAKPFACDKCDKRFIVRSRLIIHQQRVHKPRNFECETCRKMFPSTYDLERHSRVHTGERPFSCCFCYYSSNTQGNLVKHVRNVHKMHNFTYKEILIESGLKTDPKKSLSPEEMRQMRERSRRETELHLKQLRDKGLTSVSLEQLERESKIKRKTVVSKLPKMKIKKSGSEGIERRKAKKPRSKMKAQGGGSRKKKKKKDPTNGTTNGFQIPICTDFIISESNQTIHKTEKVEVLPTSPTIQVIWNMNYNEGGQKMLSKRSKACKGKRRRIDPLSKKRSNSKYSSFTSEVASDHGESIHSLSALNSPSRVLVDNEPLMNNLNDTNIYHDNGNVLVEPLSNLHSDLVGFDEIEPSNTVVVTSDEINELDAVYKNLELCNEFLQINEDDGGDFVNSMDPNGCQREREILFSSAKVDRDQIQAYEAEREDHRSVSFRRERSKVDVEKKRDYICSERAKGLLRKGVSSLDGVVTKKMGSRRRKSFRGEGKSEMGESQKMLSFCVDAKNSHVSNKGFHSDKENYVPHSASCSGIVLLGSNDTGTDDGFYSSHIADPVDFTKEITITDSLVTNGAFNDELEVISIAGIDESEKEVVLVVDCLS